MTELINAYTNTEYKVYNPPMVIKIGIKNQELNNLVHTLNKTTWAYITAFNPFSKSLSKEENLKRHKELKDKIASYKFFEGEGVGEDKTWEPEISFLVVGISPEEAIAIGNFFEQNAIVMGDINGVPELKILVQNH
jgi:hypothetical protein